MIKYMVRLSPTDRAQLSMLVTTGRAAAAKLRRARVLLKADIEAGERRWTDTEIAEALETSESTVQRVRQAWVDQGLEAALVRKRPTSRQYRKRDGAQEAQLIAVAYSAPPDGRAQWTLQLLADKLVELDIVDRISAECVRTTLKKTPSNRGSTNRGSFPHRPMRTLSVPWKMS
jgi:transposase